MFRNLYNITQQSIAKNPKIKKAIGIFLVILGMLAFVTPFTPGSWLIFVGLELLGVRFLLWDKIKSRL